MAIQITEYTIPNQTSFTASLYVGSQVLTTGVKSTSPLTLVAYILEDTSKDKETHEYQAVQTGTQVAPNTVLGDYDYIATFYISSTVQWHLFEKVRDSQASGKNPNQVGFR